MLYKERSNLDYSHQAVYSSKIQIMKRNAGNPFSPRYLASWIGLGFLWALSLVPMRILYPVGTVIGDLLRTLISSRRQIAERNLELCMPVVYCAIRVKFWVARSCPTNPAA